MSKNFTKTGRHVRNPVKWVCDSCSRKNPEYYMLKDDVWAAAIKKDEHLLCLSCVQDQLGRPLITEDFIDCPLNAGIFGFNPKRWIENKEKNPNYYELGFPAR